MNIILIISILTFLIAVTGLYVAAEFSAVSASRPRLSQMEDEGNVRAARMLAIIEDPHRLDEYVAACQLGITVAGLLLGYYGQASLNPIIVPWLEGLGRSSDVAQTLSTTLVLIILTVFTVIIGELIPKNLGLQMPESVVTAVSPSMRWSIWLFKPMIWFFNGSGRIILRLMGASAVSEHMHVHSPEEIRMLVEESSAGGVLQHGERRLIVNTLELRNLTARKVMIPRNHMLTADINLGSKSLLDLLARSQYSRLPLYEKSVDSIIGMVHLKDLLYLVHSGNDSDEALREILREVGFVPESMPAEGVLQSMQRKRNYVVIVADEYGGTAGMITVEDLFEEIIGEFDDEFDPDRVSLRLDADENRLFVHGDVEIEDLNKWTDLNLPLDTVNTVGGLVFSQLGKMPTVGETISVQLIDPDPFGIHDDKDSPTEKSSQSTEDEESVEDEEGTKHEPTTDLQQVDLRVEQMEGNSIVEVSMPLTDEQALKLEELDEA